VRLFLEIFNGSYSIGGPVYIPKVYDGRNKTFFFTSLDYTHDNNFTASGLDTLPSAAFKRGDFSALLDPSYTGVAGCCQIYDPRSPRMVNGVAVRDPFAGNIIAQSALNPISLNMLQMAPLPDPTYNRLLNNTPVYNADATRQHIFGFKVDHLITPSHRVSAFVNYQYLNAWNNPAQWDKPPGQPTGSYQQQYRPGRLVRLSYDATISPTMFNHLAAGHNRFGNLFETPFNGEDWASKYGMQNIPGTTPPLHSPWCRIPTRTFRCAWEPLPERCRMFAAPPSTPRISR
jgi:hypothetical protein